MNLILFLSILFNIQMFSQNSEPGKIYNSAEDVCPLKVGEKIPETSIVNLNGDSKTLSTIIGVRPSIIIFYRGGWCPYCNMQMSQLVTIEDTLINLGYQIIAISMDIPAKLKESLEKYEMKYSLYSDSKAYASKAFGIAFRVSNEYYKKLKSHNIDLEEASGEKHRILPVPSVFIVKNGIIQFEYVNPDYKIRIKRELLLTAAKTYIK